MSTRVISIIPHWKLYTAAMIGRETWSPTATKTVNYSTVEQT